MRTIACAVVVAVALVAPAAALSSPWEAIVEEHGLYEPRPGILIEGDDAFLAPLSGVRGGSGTPEDPYRITNYAIVGEQNLAIGIVNTTKHVLIEDILVPSATNEYGLIFSNASNITVRRMSMPEAYLGAYMIDVRDILLEDIEVVTHQVVFSQFYNLYFARAERVTVRGYHADGGGLPLGMGLVKDVLIENSVFENAFASGGIGRLENVTLDNVTFRNADFSLQNVNRGVSVVRSRFEGAASFYTYASFSTSPVDIQALYLCGNTFATSGSDTPLRLTNARDIAMVGNTLGPSGASALSELTNVSGVVERNTFAESSAPVLLMADGAIAGRDNALLGGATGTVHLRGAADFRGNWWGDATGPSLQGPGSGTRVNATPGATYSPWLVEAPDTSVDCDADYARPAPEPLPPPPGPEGEYQRHELRSAGSVAVNLTIPPSKWILYANFTLAEPESRWALVESVSSGWMGYLAGADRRLVHGEIDSPVLQVDESLPAPLAGSAELRLIASCNNPIECGQWRRELVGSVGGIVDSSWVLLTSVPTNDPFHEVTARTGMFGLEEMDGTARISTTGPSFATGLFKKLTIEGEMFGISKYRPGLPDSHTLLLSAPDYSGSGDSRWMRGSPAGNYTWRYSGVAGTAPRLDVLWADFPDAS